LSRKTAIFIALIGIALAYSIWVVTTPKWVFSVSTDKSTYALGEHVNVTVTIKNLGFITHSFKSQIIDPVVVIIDHVGRHTYIQVWYGPSPIHFNVTEFSVMPGQSLERSFIWDQTNIHQEGEEAEPGEYYIKAHVPRADSTYPGDADKRFRASTFINITSFEP
jgi:hypothetical protein